MRHRVCESSSTQPSEALRSPWDPYAVRLSNDSWRVRSKSWAFIISFSGDYDVSQDCSTPVSVASAYMPSI